MIMNMLLEEPEVDKGNYEFFKIPTNVTSGFSFVFADFYGEIVHLSLELLKEKYPKGNINKLQRFSVDFDGLTVKYYALSNTKVGETNE